MSKNIRLNLNQKRNTYEQTQGFFVQALSILKNIFGFKSFRGHQEEIIENLINGGNALVLMSTGAGKSLCYQVPALVRSGTAIVVSPLIALMHNQVMALKHLGVRAEFLNSSLSAKEAFFVSEKLKNGHIDLLYVAPERLMMPSFLEMLESVKIALFAIDEAHCVSQWGHDFRPEYLELGILAQKFANIPRIALTATADQLTRNEIIDKLHLKDAKVFASGFDRPNIRYTIAEKDNPKKQLLNFIKEEHANDSGIIYCLSRKSVDDLALWLKNEGIDALPYHAGLSREAREKNQNRFLHEEKIVMVATIAFGMGIDKPNVRFVAHLDLPKSIEAYYQETGRAGRDGLFANAWLLYGLQDVIIHRQMNEESEMSMDIKRREQRKLDALLGLCETIACRRKVLLQYFGETLHENCQNCDTCLNPKSTWNATKEAKLALSAVYRTGQRFGVAHLIDVLLGKQTDKIVSFSHHRLNVFGLGQDHKATTWRSIYRQLIAMRFIHVEIESYGALKLTKECAAFLKGENELWLRKTAESKKAIKKPSLARVKHEESNLFQQLRALRLTLAKEHGVPPYVIFHDKTLFEIAESKPKNIDEMSVIHGVGAQKLTKYGDAFLKAIEQYELHSSITA